MFWFILVGFVTVPETMPGLHSMHRFGPETKLCTDLAKNETMHLIMFLGTNSDVFVPFGQFTYYAGNLAEVAFNATIQVEIETMHRFGPEMKRTQSIMFFGP